jgi:hypothetical protein
MPYDAQGRYGEPSYAPRIKYREGMPAPAGYHLEESPRKGLVIAGAVTLGTTYFLSALIGGASSNPDDRWLLVPVFGPFVDAGNRGSHGCIARGSSTPSDQTCEALETVVVTYLVFDGVAQAAGGILLALGFALPKKEFVSDTYYGLSSGPRVASWVVVPQVTPGARYGLVLRGEVF